MIALLQRVSSAEVRIAHNVCASIDYGLLALIGVQQHDSRAEVSRLAHKILHYRIFADGNGHMNLDVLQAQGAVLLVPQFTLAADTQRGLRPGFSGAAAPQTASALFQQLVDETSQSSAPVNAGRFGADMQVSLTNDGPVTFWLQV